jgi:membrane-bound serine protease (ClpP class)
MKGLLPLLLFTLSSLFAASTGVEIKSVDPLNDVGLLFIVVGMSFMILEVFVIGFGILGIGGVIAFTVGSILLFNADTIPLVVAFSLVSLAFFIMLIRLYLKSRFVKVVVGLDEMIGLKGQVVDVTDAGYHVLCHAEIWSATSQVKLRVGESVQVVGLSDLVLEVKPLKE